MNENDVNISHMNDDTNQFDRNIPAPQVAYIPPKKRSLSKGALSAYILIVAVLYALVIFLSITVSNVNTKIDDTQIDKSYIQTHEV